MYLSDNVLKFNQNLVSKMRSVKNIYLSNAKQNHNRNPTIAGEFSRFRSLKCFQFFRRDLSVKVVSIDIVFPRGWGAPVPDLAHYPRAWPSRPSTGRNPSRQTTNKRIHLTKPKSRIKPYRMIYDILLNGPACDVRL